MNKCPNCGNEFDGKFCPSCGMKWEDEKECPSCGCILPGAARFCTECGYSFAGEARATRQVDFRQKAYSLLRFVPIMIFALFSVLLFAFYAGSVVELVMGAGLPNESLGSLYTMNSGLLSEVPNVEWVMIVLIVLALISVIFSCVSSAIVRKNMYKEIRICGKDRPLSSLFCAITFGFYVLFLAAGVAIVCTISSMDEGMGVLTSGACPICLILFSLVFALANVASLSARRMLAGRSPELAEFEATQKAHALAAEKARREKFYATHAAPVAPVKSESRKIYKRQMIEYKYAKRNYDKAKESRTPAAVIWLDIHKVSLAVCTVMVAIVVTFSCLVYSYLSNIFRVNVVEKVELGFTHEQVEKVLGSPNEERSTDNLWRYYSSSYTSILDKIAENDKKLEKAMTDDNDERYFKLLDEAAALREQLSSVAYSYIEINFGGDAHDPVVSSVFFDKARRDSDPNVTKEVKDVTLSADTIGYFSIPNQDKFYAGLDGNGKKIHYYAYFSDGAYYRAYMSGETVNFHDDLADIEWSDNFASYKISKSKIYKTIEKLGTIDSDGKFTSELNSIEFEEENGIKYLGQYLIGVADRSINSAAVRDDTVCICEGAFKGCKNLLYLTIPSSVTTIGNYAFYLCESLVSVTIPDSVTSIGERSFEFCPIREATMPAWAIKYIPKNDLTKVVLTSGDSIGDYAFKGCRSLTSIVIPEGVTSIGDSAFYGCYKLVEVYDLSGLHIEQGSSSNGYVGYYARDIYTSLDIPSKIGEVENYLFYDVNEAVYLLGYKGNNTELTLPKDYKGNDYKIYQYAFYNCSSLTSITIPEGVTSIGEYAFSGCESLVNVTIPEGVKSIGYGAFEGCENLEYNYYNGDSRVKYLGNEQNKYLVLYSADKELTQYTIPNTTKVVCDYAFEGCSSLTSIEIPDSVTSIGRRAFSGCSSLTSIEIPDSVTSIGEYAFYGCHSFTSIIIPESVTSIAKGAFSYCSSLTSVTIPDSVTSIGEYAFDGCTNLQTVTFAKDSKLQIIGDSAFYGCSNLTSIIIPDSVTSIGYYAFEFCFNLQDVYYHGTAEEWENINIGPYNGSLTDTKLYYYADRDPYKDGTAVSGQNYWHYNESGEVEIWQN